MTNVELAQAAFVGDEGEAEMVRGLLEEARAVVAATLAEDDVS